MTNSAHPSSAEDFLSTIVAHLGLRSSVLGRVILASPYGLRMARSPEMMFHALVRGNCYFALSAAGAKKRRLEPGDLVLFPRGTGHLLLSSPLAEVIPSDRVCYTTATEHGDRFQSGAGKKTEMICGSFSINGAHAALLLPTLPQIIHIRAKGEERDRWICSTLGLLANEVARRGEGSSLVIQQLLDTLFVQILRSSSMELAEQNRGLFAALRDRAMVEVLNCINTHYTRSWTLEELAKECGLSRTALAVKFQSLFGQGVATFLRNQRISCARRLLAESKLSVKEIAHEVGYSSSEVFIRNFERLQGLSPARYRSRLAADETGSGRIVGR